MDAPLARCGRQCRGPRSRGGPPTACAVDGRAALVAEPRLEPERRAMVSAAGRVFWICDESLRGIDGTVPDQWFLRCPRRFQRRVAVERPCRIGARKSSAARPATEKASPTGLQHAAAFGQATGSGG